LSLPSKYNFGLYFSGICFTTIMVQVPKETPGRKLKNS
jgi:hypothetical protein